MGCVGEARLSELQLTGLRLARRKQEGGPALRAFMFISKKECALARIRPFLQSLAASILELELELVQSHMAQKLVLRGEVGCACVAREVSVERGGMVSASAPAQ